MYVLVIVLFIRDSPSKDFDQTSLLGKYSCVCLGAAYDKLFTGLDVTLVTNSSFSIDAPNIVINI